MKLLDNFFQRFFTEVTDFYHILLGTVNKILDGINACTLQAVEASNRHVKLLDGHLKDFFLLGFFTFNHDFGVLGGV